MKIIIYWFRNDLRLTDNPGLTAACQDGDYVLPIYIHSPSVDQETSWGFERVGQYRQQFLNESLSDLKNQLKQLGSDLFEFRGEPLKVISDILQIIRVTDIYCQQIEAPEEKIEVQSLVDLNISIKQSWQSTMLEPLDLPFEVSQMPDMYTVFRRKIEEAKLKFARPLPKLNLVPPLPERASQLSNINFEQKVQKELQFRGGESHALAHIEQYLNRRLPDTYKQTRNGLMGMNYSSKFSPWLALGCCSARTIAKRIDDYENQYGANDGTYWLWFELLWRDYFSFLPFKYGKKLFKSMGLVDRPLGKFNVGQFNQWINGQTENDFVNAGMIELAKTGYLSNRMRQIVASYWIYDMGGDWRAGAAWFESQLIDYDVYSNQGNWLYIAGRGTDPRGGRPFNVQKQTKDHDPDGQYRDYWLSSEQN